jgi:hypothetical protein
MKAIVVLADGETWTTLDGCSIKVVTDADLEGLADGDLHISELEALAEINLKEVIFQ